MTFTEYNEQVLDSLEAKGFPTLINAYEPPQMETAVWMFAVAIRGFSERTPPPAIADEIMTQFTTIIHRIFPVH